MTALSTRATSRTTAAITAEANDKPDYDVLVVGAGMAGLYMLHRLRQSGFNVAVIETAGDVGGTWYWNRYPGARCDVPTTDYTYSFDSGLEDEWEWSEKYARQPEILAYLNHVTERYDLRRDITFNTIVGAAHWDATAELWNVELHNEDGKHVVTTRWYVMATGCLSVPKQPEFPSADRFNGEVYFTGRWPHEPVDFTEKRVAVIGTGSSAIQAIPEIAQAAAQLSVFQRTPNYSLPAHHGPRFEPGAQALAADRAEYRQAARWSSSGMPLPPATEGALTLDEQERLRRYEKIWATGHLIAHSTQVSDLLFNAAANETFAEFVRGKLHAIVDDPEVAARLCPRDHPFATKRPCLDDGYYETFNRDNVELVDLRHEPVTQVTEHGIETSQRSFEFDVIVYATGFDAMTGAIVNVDITGRDHTIADAWAEGPETYLGLMTVGFPNLFLVTGPGSPSVLSNMAVSIEQHIELIDEIINYLANNDFTTIEPTPTAQAGWETHAADCAAITLFPRAHSWYMGHNVPGKPIKLMPYIGGVGAYRGYCEKAIAEGYLGFRISGPAGEQLNDGQVARLQPDVKRVLDTIAEIGLPPLDTLPPAEARAFNRATGATAPPGPAVGAVIDGQYRAADGDLEYRLYRPATPGPHAGVLYLHGGGWVLGDHTSDDAMVRDLCAQSGVAFVSVNYRHGPEHRFPAAHDDAWAALQWMAANADELGLDGERLAVAGWSAGANMAAHLAQRARDDGGPRLAAQLLITPVTDVDVGRGSYIENGADYLLTSDLMKYFFEHYVDVADRDDVRLAPLHAPLQNLPPAWIFTAEFDPLRDEGEAYATALRAAGNTVEHIAGRGHIHTSVQMYGLVLSGAEYRTQAATFLRSNLNQVPDN